MFDRMRNEFLWVANDLIKEVYSGSIILIHRGVPETGNSSKRRISLIQVVISGKQDKYSIEKKLNKSLQEFNLKPGVTRYPVSIISGYRVACR